MLLFYDLVYHKNASISKSAIAPRMLILDILQRSLFAFLTRVINYIISNYYFVLANYRFVLFNYRFIRANYRFVHALFIA